MHHITMGIFATLTLGTAGYAPPPLQSDLLLFRDGRVLVRQTMPVRIPAGRSTQRLSLDQHDAGSLAVLDSGVALLEAQYPYSIDVSSLYARSVGRRLVFRPKGRADTVSARIVGVDPTRFEVAGGVTLTAPGEPVFPAELVGVARTVEATLESPRSLDVLHLGYLTSGATWSAEYSLVYRAGRALVSGNASLKSISLTADSAEVTLLDGMVNRAAAFARQQSRPDQLGFQALRLEEIVVTGAAAGEPTITAVGGVHLYGLSGRHSLAPGVTSVVRLFAPVPAPVERFLSIPGALPMYGPGGAGRQTPPVELHYRVRRSRGTPFGDLPLPGGVARLYAESPAGDRLLIGEAALAHSAAGGDLDLLAGFAQEITAVREEGEQTMAQDSVQRADGGINIRNVAILRTYKVSLTNRSDSTETIEIVERRSGVWNVVTSTVPAERLTPETIRFRVTVPARGEAVLNYRVRLQMN